MRKRVPGSASLYRRAFLLKAGTLITALPALSFARYLDEESSIFPLQYSDEEWLRILGQARYRVMREAVMETPLSSNLLLETRPGIYLCAGCGATLFLSENKLDKVGGWPTFSEPAEQNAISLGPEPDWTALVRRRIYCARCGGYLGMVFSDGADGYRFAINGLALKFIAVERNEFRQTQPVNNTQ